MQSISLSANCKFFRHVLLEDKMGYFLKAKRFKDEPTQYCTICGKAFQSTSNNEK